MGQQLQQGIMLTGVVYTIAAAQLMKMIYVSEAHRAANTAETDSASFLHQDYFSLHFQHIKQKIHIALLRTYKSIFPNYKDHCTRCPSQLSLDRKAGSLD